MSRLEDLTPNASVRGILPNSLATVVNVQWHGSAALELTYKAPDGKVANELLFRLTGQDALAVRASKRLRNEELLVPALAGTRLRMELDRVPLWRGDHVSIKLLLEDFARYLYLPRLKGPEV